MCSLCISLRDENTPLPFQCLVTVCPVSNRFQGNIIVRYENDILVSMSVFWDCYLHTLKNSNYNFKSLDIGICSEIFYHMWHRPKNQKD